jgi:hypothetical protein
MSGRKTLRSAIIAWTATGVLVAIALSAAPGMADAAPASVSVSDLGYPHGEIGYGAGPRFVFRMPVYAGVRAVRVTFDLTVAPIVDGNSPIVLSAGGYPVREVTASQLRHLQSVTADIPLSGDGATDLELTVEGYLSSAGTCGAKSHAVWMMVGPESTVQFDTADDQPAPASFFEDYRGRFAYDVDAHASPTTRDLAVTLPYWLHQMERWRTVTIVPRSSTAGAARTLVLGDYRRSLRVSKNTLYASPFGLQLLTMGGSTPLLEHPQRLDLDDFGANLRPNGLDGRDEIAIRFSLGQIGGIPDDMHAWLNVAHSALPGTERANIDVTLNGVLVNSFSVLSSSREESLDVPIDGRLVRSDNDLRVSLDDVPQRTACAIDGSGARLALMPGSALTWSAVRPAASSIGDFFNDASGDVVVLLQSPASRPAAAMLLDRLGAVNSTMSEIDVRPYEGSVPTGYDFAIVVGTAYHPEHAGGTNMTILPLLDTSYGILETVESGATPTLVLTYAGNPRIMGSLASLTSGQLSGEHADMLLFNRNGVAYVPGERADDSGQDAISRPLGVLTVAPMFGFALVAALTWISLRAGRAS